ncbi:Hsp20/alpha crystallin family protein [Halobacillus salinarum]|uniref:Hsp20/alpha crystallin family protein n=1 Tax=Halobacillus salinarum TaxID=2932257 RepID=A0ABY4EJ68_9BACI|nr:Hsp20/alpha crystallin family protein [Halobacillus salinarum]UOQ44097.1 Hsp20/alpha crystallin family protein [Halobacillus salinarum]
MNQFGEWKSNLDRFFGQEFWGEFEGLMKPAIPQINLYQYDHELVCIANLPGLEHPKNVDVFVDHASLTLRGKIEVNKRGGRQLKNEIADGAFERTVELPFAVRSDSIDASYKHGLLIIKLYRYISDSTREKNVNVRYLDEN